MYWLVEYAFPSFSLKKLYKWAAVPCFRVRRNIAFPPPRVAPSVSINTGEKERFAYSTTTTKPSFSRAEGTSIPFSHVSVSVSSSATVAFRWFAFCNSPTDNCRREKSPILPSDRNTVMFSFMNAL